MKYKTKFTDSVSHLYLHLSTMSSIHAEYQLSYLHNYLSNMKTNTPLRILRKQIYNPWQP